MARWTVLVGEPAQRDFHDIINYAVEHFGARHARVYEKTLRMALTALRAGPNVRGAKALEELGSGFCVLHVARQDRRGRHLIVYRAGPEHTIQVLRILHDAMDLKQHLPKED